MPDPARALSVPPTEIISTSLKVEEVSLRVKVMVAVWPDLRVLLSEVMAMLGATVSTLMES